jgi:hypothetical protein
MDDLKDTIRRAVMRAIHKAGNRHGESRLVPLPAVELLADELADELVQLIEIFRQGGDA